MTKTLAANEGGAGRAVLITRMLSKGVHVLTEAKVTEITEDTISYEKDGEVHTIADADTLVLAMGYRPNTKLARRPCRRWRCCPRAGRRQQVRQHPRCHRRRLQGCLRALVNPFAPIDCKKRRLPCVLGSRRLRFAKERLLSGPKCLLLLLPPQSCCGYTPGADTSRRARRWDCARRWRRPHRGACG